MSLREVTAMQARRSVNIRAVTHAHLDVLLRPKLSLDVQVRMYVAIDQARANQRGKP